jgi:RHS repeat-associated protein
LVLWKLKKFYYHYDGLGNVVAISDVNGTVIESYEYDVFGEPTIWDVRNPTEPNDVESSIVGNPYMFTGRNYTGEIGLYYYRARYYNPYMG